MHSQLPCNIDKSFTGYQQRFCYCFIFQMRTSRGGAHGVPIRLRLEVGSRCSLGSQPRNGSEGQQHWYRQAMKKFQYCAHRSCTTNWRS